MPQRVNIGALGCAENVSERKNDMKNIVVLVSGGGTNLQALIDAQERGEIKGGKISCVISSKEGAYALERAAKAGIPAVTLPRKDYADKVSYSMAIKEELDRQKADLVVLAGFMIILDECLTKAYPYKIINVHPALIPSFCGEGFYGLKVHEKALEYGVKVSGATIHFVNEEADAGAIILQGAVDIANDETPETLQRKIMENVEWKLLPKAVSLFCEDRITIKDGKAYVDLK
ncbi:phosphoribosylglycinamide formyltransferase [Ruminococcus albus 8]|uniref:Phosphoribosylglycinamide formyltransferase n=2 Tax=Oscillospiraceae TaxID=216572 RepID=E9SEC5_RUMAL|nr:phosphoribosylglycinamide formyltransferase [Ruminococcus albus 8]